jgi:WhiB family redox-sensing transcriptional regulator
MRVDPWQDRAACADLPVDWFYPDKGRRADRAKAVCRRCPVRVECGDYAIATNEVDGIWGGMSRRQREREAYRRVS